MLSAHDIPFGRPIGAQQAEGAKSFMAEHGTYRLDCPDLGLTFVVEHLYRDKHEVAGELTVLCSWAGARTFAGALYRGTMNLSAIRTRSEKAKYLAERSKNKEVDWGGLVEEVCQRVLAAEREGDPPQILADAPDLPPDAVQEVSGLPVLADHPMILFGDGGSAKSYLALWVAAQLPEKRILYVDWEFSASDHKDRLRRLVGEPIPRSIWYIRGERPLKEEAERIRRVIQREQIGYVICDSIAFAAGGAPESAEIATQYFGAVRSFGVGSMHIAHISKAEQGDQKPFGSAFWHNAARSTWFIQRALDTASTDEVLLALHHRKANTGRLRPALGFRVTFGFDRTHIVATDAASGESAELSDKLPVWQRMRAVLARRTMTCEEVAAALDKPVDTIAKTVRRMDMFTRIPSGDGKTRIALAAERHSDGNGF